MIKDINAGYGSSRPLYLAEANNTLFFNATNGSSNNGHELWKSDGTTPGTVMVKDIRPGKGSSSPQCITNVDGTVFFRLLMTLTVQSYGKVMVQKRGLYW